MLYEVTGCPWVVPWCLLALRERRRGQQWPWEGGGKQVGSDLGICRLLTQHLGPLGDHVIDGTDCDTTGHSACRNAPCVPSQIKARKQSG